MKAKHVKAAGTVLGVILAIVMYLIFCGISWIITCGLYKLITLCFGWTFSWGIATGGWLIAYLLRCLFSKGD